MTATLPSIVTDPAVLATMSNEEIAAQMEQLRQFNALLRQTATERGIEVPRISRPGRPLTTGSLFAAVKAQARIQFQLDRFNKEMEEATAHRADVEAKYLESNGFAELPEGLTAEIEEVWNTEYQARVQKAAERSAAAAENVDGEQPKRRGRRPKNQDA